MKIINFITPHFIPENTACTNRVLSYVKELENNYKVNVITLTEKGKNSKNYMIKFSNNTNVYYVTQDYFDGRNFINRALNEIKYIYKLIKVSKNLNADITIATTPYMFMMPLVGYLVKGKKILDIRDIVWEYLDENTFLKKVIKQSLSFIMNLSIKKYSSIVVTNDYEYKKLKEYNPIVISNGIDQEKFCLLSSLEYKVPEKFTVTYVGNIGLAQNIMILVLAAEQLKTIYFNIIGDGIEFQAIKQYVQENNLKNVNLLGKLDWYELSFYYKATSVLYAQLDEKFATAMPSKLYEYASTGIPIIYGGSGHATDFVKELEHSFVVKPNDVKQLSNAILEVKKENYTVSTKNQKIIQQNYIRENNIKKILALL